MELCRVCLDKDTEMVQLFDSDNADDTLGRIEFCTGVVFTKMEALPSKICTSCFKDLQTAYRFKTNCLDSQNKLTLSTVKVKEENGLSDIDDGTMHDDDIFNDVKMEESDLKLDDDVISNVKAGKVMLKNKCDSVCIEEQPKPVTSRGPYKKRTGDPKKIRQFKFRKLFCETCNIKFKSKQDSDEHKKELHTELWICEVCGKAFTYRASYASHMRLHSAPGYACSHCDYRTANKHDLGKHLRIHSDVKTYICPICASAYRTNSNLHAHIRLKHERVRRYACSLCARTFYDRTKLNRHVDSHNDIKRYSCEVCHACFTRRCYWKKHLLKQHDITIPTCRPGRRRTEAVLRDKMADADPTPIVGNIGPKESLVLKL